MNQVTTENDVRDYSLLHSTNMVGVASGLIASTEFNANPVVLHIAGTRDSARGLFSALETLDTPQKCGELFQYYMSDVFGENLQNHSAKQTDKRRYRNSYLRLIQDWGMDSNNLQAAVLKGWVESRFGLYPTYHKQVINTIYDKVWIQYVEDKMHSRYHNNCIYMQLDLLYEFCQWFIHRFKQPAEKFITLYRGVNAIEKQCVADIKQTRHKTVRFNNLTSFTNSKATADEFGDTVLKVTVPVVKIVFFNQLLPHHALHGESEYLVIGGDYQVELL